MHDSQEGPHTLMACFELHGVSTLLKCGTYNLDMCMPGPQVKQMLGEGGSGQTFLCIHRATGKAVAIKMIPRPVPKVVLPMLMHEIMVSCDQDGFAASAQGRAAHADA